MAKEKKSSGPPKKKSGTSAAGPYKSGMKTDRSVGVRKMTEAQKKEASKPRSFVPKSLERRAAMNPPSKPKSGANKTKVVHGPMSPKEMHDRVVTGVESMRKSVFRELDKNIRDPKQRYYKK